MMRGMALAFSELMFYSRANVGTPTKGMDPEQVPAAKPHP
jgi:hypothetical protein